MSLDEWKEPFPGWKTVSRSHGTAHGFIMIVVEVGQSYVRDVRRDVSCNPSGAPQSEHTCLLSRCFLINDPDRRQRLECVTFIGDVGRSFVRGVCRDIEKAGHGREKKDLRRFQ